MVNVLYTTTPKSLYDTASKRIDSLLVDLANLAEAGNKAFPFALRVGVAHLDLAGARETEDGCGMV